MIKENFDLVLLRKIYLKNCRYSGLDNKDLNHNDIKILGEETICYFGYFLSIDHYLQEVKLQRENKLNIILNES